MKSILFTKKFPNGFLQKELGEKFYVESEDFIQIKYKDLNEIKTQLAANSTNYIISSFHVMDLILKLDLNGKFYCVGEKTAQKLIENGKKVVFFAQNATELSKLIINEISISTEFTYLCSHIRREIIPENLEKEGFRLNEIIVYKTLPKDLSLKKIFDAYVFFSPSGFKSFIKQNTIPEKACIFALGSTTQQAIENKLNQKVYIPQKSTVESLIKVIKQKSNAEK